MIVLLDDFKVVSKAKSVGGISDGNHTFDELYDHRCLLFTLCMANNSENAWFSKTHDDGEVWNDWFIAGIELPSGTITYHLPDKMWNTVVKSGATELDRAPKWDGHTSDDVLKRIENSIGVK